MNSVTLQHADFLKRVKAGEYEGVDPTGTQWRVVRENSSRWMVVKDRADDFLAATFEGARIYIGGEVREAVDPEYAERQRVRREQRKARRVRRLERELAEARS